MVRRPQNSQEVRRASTRGRKIMLRSPASGFTGSNGTENLLTLTHFGVVGYHPEMSPRLLQSFSGIIDSTQFARAETGFPMPRSIEQGYAEEMKISGAPHLPKVDSGRS